MNGAGKLTLRSVTLDELLVSFYYVYKDDISINHNSAL